MLSLFVYVEFSKPGRGRRALGVHINLLSSSGIFQYLLQRLQSSGNNYQVNEFTGQRDQLLYVQPLYTQELGL